MKLIKKSSRRNYVCKTFKVTKEERVRKTLSQNHMLNLQFLLLNPRFKTSSDVRSQKQFRNSLFTFSRNPFSELFKVNFYWLNVGVVVFKLIVVNHCDLPNRKVVILVFSFVLRMFCNCRGHSLSYCFSWTLTVSPAISNSHFLKQF